MIVETKIHSKPQIIFNQLINGECKQILQSHKNKRLFDANPEETVGIIKIKCPLCKSVIAVSFRNQKVRTERIATQ